VHKSARTDISVDEGGVNRSFRRVPRGVIDTVRYRTNHESDLVNKPDWSIRSISASKNRHR
jgi:hypothetical protein